MLQASKDFLKGMGLGLIADQLADLKLGELLNTPPPGLDEAVAIGKVGASMINEAPSRIKSEANPLSERPYPSKHITLPNHRMGLQHSRPGQEASVHKLIRMERWSQFWELVKIGCVGYLNSRCSKTKRKTLIHKLLPPSYENEISKRGAASKTRMAGAGGAVREEREVRPVHPHHL